MTYQLTIGDKKMGDQAQKLREIMQNHHDSSRRNTRIIAVSSGKGGVGKTNIAINMALAYAQLGKKVVVMDADLGLANVNVVLGIIPRYNLYHLIKIVAGASGFSKIANLTDDERNNIVNEFSELSLADILIIDTGAGVSNNVLSFIAAADDALIVTTPEPTAITDAYGIIKIIATEIDNINIGLKLIVNKVKSVTEGKRVAERVINIAGQFLNLKIDYLGSIYDDILVHQSVVKQKPFLLADTKSKASICIKHLVGRLENIEYKEGSGISGFLKKLFTKK